MQCDHSTEDAPDHMGRMIWWGGDVGMWGGGVAAASFALTEVWIAAGALAPVLDRLNRINPLPGTIYHVTLKTESQATTGRLVPTVSILHEEFFFPPIFFSVIHFLSPVA